MARSRIDVGVTVALTWLLIAVGVHVLIAPQLGLRGWAWLALHDVLCLVGTSHELWRGWKRRAERLAEKAAREAERQERLEELTRPAPAPRPRTL